MMAMNRKIIGVAMIAVFAVAIVFGGVHSTLAVIEATSASAAPGDGEYVARLATASDDDPAVSALKYVCLFH